ncbi:3-deoxy-7-phosphoheptulonate synthase [Vibrio sp. vnigr-6D03]|uniref:3-deoxy-7-phosphoheptulonate synthase n=1 Tax=Vibrio sp. vnigr-6D03 TaxID=2058088 RepID=UPI000C342686|nr:3-deoxy-7-phosphoheptulonate synthase [Vibrio sp. vnigr-6D03]PKF80056.1 3-deoxy-7-phosphoheptulonate synthase [Vibrio sp. vnigr-6D03]
MEVLTSLNIQESSYVYTPNDLDNKHPITRGIAQSVAKSRERIAKIIEGKCDRLLVIVGPCSIHDENSAIEYAEKLAELNKMYKSHLEIVMRSYFEKPRTRNGWKGLIYDPYLNGTLAFNDGLKLSRKILKSINELGLSAATEFLEPLHANYLQDLVSWGAIGARTTECQLHRQMASGFPFPIGFKNGTDGNVDIATDAIVSAAAKHRYMSLDRDSRLSETTSIGNSCGHLILRGGKKPNYDEFSLQKARIALREAGITSNLIVDCSHGNSQKKHVNQLVVLEEMCRQLTNGCRYLAGVMLESFLVEGSQQINDCKTLTYGQSITDPCIGWKDTEAALEKLAEAAACRSHKNSI